MISVSDSLSFLKFTDDEKRAVSKLEGTIDMKLGPEWPGTPVKLDFPEPISPKIACEVQRRYEAGGWRVQVAPSAASCSFIFMPTGPTVAKVDAPCEEKSQAIISPTIVVAPAAPRRLLVRMPTRARSGRAVDVLTSYRKMAGIPITIEVVIDEDDAAMMRADTLQRLHALQCVITVGRHKSKIEAVNGGRVKDWDILLLASDDMVPVQPDYAKIVVDEMERHWPHLDGAIYFDDGFQHDHLVTLPIFGRRLYDQFGYVYDPHYQSLFCDTEQTRVLGEMGRLKYVDQKIIEHQHPVTGKVQKDPLYLRNDALWNADEAVYKARETKSQPHAQFAFDSPPLWLSIGILTVEHRRQHLEMLLDHLYDQILKHAPRQVEIIVNGGVGAIGGKRQEVLQKARGQFIAFIDDDDWVSHDYIESIIGALRSSPDTDCIGLMGSMTTSWKEPETFIHSMKIDRWHTEGKVHYRSPNHINPCRRELALQAGFQNDLQHGEDHGYSIRIKPWLKNEIMLEKDLYSYFYIPAKGFGR